MGISTVQTIVKEVSEAVWDELCPEFMNPPYTRLEWEAIAMGFEHYWQFPHCCGVLDGKHCIIQCPPKSWSLYWNYKKSFSITLMALVDSRYKYVIVDVGAAGMEGDSNTFKNSAFGMQFMYDEIPFPVPRNLPRSQTHAPFVLIGNETFPGEIHLMKPYSRKSKAVTEKIHAVFNYHLSHARMCVECSFGILTARFHFLLRRIILSPEAATVAVKAACILHNYLMRDNDPLVQAVESKLMAKLELEHEEHAAQNFQKKNAEDAGLVPLPPLPGYHTSFEARQIHNLFTTYFRSLAGYILWQELKT